jgi:hypothetical protein
MSVVENLKAPPSLFEMRDAKFTFKKADPISGTKRAPVEIQIPVPNFEGLIAFIQPSNDDGTAIDQAKMDKNVKFILDLLADVVKDQARQQVNDEEKPVNKQEELNLDQLTLDYIANIPPSERLAAGVPKETWESFAKYYAELMPGITGKKAESIQAAITLFLKKLTPIKSDKRSLAILKDQLDIFITSSDADHIEEYDSIYKFLSGKIDIYLKSDEIESLTAAL